MMITSFKNDLTNMISPNSFDIVLDRLSNRTRVHLVLMRISDVLFKPFRYEPHRESGKIELTEYGMFPALAVYGSDPQYLEDVYRTKGLIFHRNFIRKNKSESNKKKLISDVMHNYVTWRFMNSDDSEKATWTFEDGLFSCYDVSAQLRESS